MSWFLEPEVMVPIRVSFVRAKGVAALEAVSWGVSVSP